MLYFGWWGLARSQSSADSLLGSRRATNMGQELIGRNSRPIIGASLSNPYTIGTALRKCVCMFVCLRPYAVNFKCAFKYFSILMHWYVGEGQCRATAKVQCWLQVRAMHKKAFINARDSVHDFIVKLTLSICSHSSFLGWRNATACDLWRQPLVRTYI